MIDIRSKAPKPNKEIVFKLPEIYKFELPNGIKIHFSEKKSLPIIQLNFIINGGSKYDRPGKEGESNLTLALIDEGAGEFDALQLNEEIEYLGSSLGLFCDQDYFYVSMLTLKKNLDRSLYLVSKIFMQPRLEEKDFLREKKKTLNRILQTKSDPGFIASAILDKLLYKDFRPYSFQSTGYEATVENINVEDVRSFYSKYITPKNVDVAVVGNIELDELKDKLNEYLGDWESSPPAEFSFTGTKNSPTAIYICNKENSVQSEVRVGQTTTGRNDSDFYARQLWNSILGGQFTSRINLNLRESKGYTYGAHSSFNYYKHNGYFFVSTAVKSLNTGDSIADILKELNGIRENISPAELEFAKSSVINKFPSQFETYGQIARNISNLIAYDLHENYFNDYLDMIRRTTLEDTIMAARATLDLQKLIILIVGDKNIVKEQLKDMKDIPIYETDTEGNLIG
ncbi:MAG TPA: pitrilysin family protein [Ignavibacteriales bacterium]|nr:pitrilysin family protein [Ignavibacteriales bacterium]